MRFTFALLAILAAAVAQPVELESRDAWSDALEVFIGELLETMRERMVSGTDNFPVMDPYFREHLHINDLVIPIRGSHITIDDTTVVGLSTFVVDSLTVNTLSQAERRFRVNLRAHIDLATADIESFDVASSFLGGVGIAGTGSASVEVTNLAIDGHINIRPKDTESGLYFESESANIRASLSTFQPTISGLQGDGMNEYVANLLSQVVPDLTVFFEPQITPVVTRGVTWLINRILNVVDFEPLIPSV